MTKYYIIKTRDEIRWDYVPWDCANSGELYTRNIDDYNGIIKDIVEVDEVELEQVAALINSNEKKATVYDKDFAEKIEEITK